MVPNPDLYSKIHPPYLSTEIDLLLFDRVYQTSFFLYQEDTKYETGDWCLHCFKKSDVFFNA